MVISARVPYDATSRSATTCGGCLGGGTAMKLPGDRSIAANENLKGVVGTWVYSLVCCGISFALFYVFAFQAQSLPGGVIGGVFSLFGIFGLWVAFRMTLDYAKFGAISVTLQ